MVSEGTNSTSERSVELPNARLANAPFKKRKSTYNARKDEIHLLQEHIKSLEAKLAKVEREAPPQPQLKDVLLTNAVLARAVEHNSLAVAGTQSMLTAYNVASVEAKGHVPMRDYIHLPMNMEARRETLASLYKSKLLAAAQFMNERTRYLDLRVAMKQIEQFELPNGAAGVIVIDITQFNGGHSLRQVYDALMFFVMNQEISFSEKLEFLTIRESEDVVEEFKYGQTRFLSSIPGGMDIETNLVMFATCVDATEASPAFMIAATDFVDQDELYPYRPDLYLRKELTGAITMREVPSPTGGAPTIVMARWSYARMPAPPFSLSDDIKAAGLASMLQLTEIIPKIVKEFLSTIVPATAV